MIIYLVYHTELENTNFFLYKQRKCFKKN